MTIVKAFPPNYAAVRRKFPEAKNHGVIFTFGDRIYNPSGVRISPYLLAHEQIHCDRQLAITPQEWWRLYIDDPNFRFDEELIAHQAEWRAVLQKCGLKHVRDQQLEIIARRLSGPLYGGVASYDKALRLIQEAA